ncbi:CotS family spore coat protein [Clostridium polynesiense]|uniref:CotS family spore coat protein n=1 Tax=Clostridium polynesiense TaxID=1325933 RepID=UPI00058FF15A|nr:CotS family spore coat protein [Clostridium polynesiense]
MSETVKANVYSYLSEQNVKAQVLPYYGLEKGCITQIKFKDTDKQRAVYRIDFKDKSYCLKKVYYEIPDLLFVYSALEWFYRYNINVPRLLPTVDKGRFVKYKDMLFILTPWIEGVKCSYDNIDHIIDSASNLARMHSAAKKFTPMDGSSNKKQLEDIFLSTQKHYDNILYCSSQAFQLRDKFSKLFLNHFETNIKLAKTALEAASTINISNLTTSLCHLDYVNKNILFDSKNEVWVIDFDKCSIDYRSHDISYFLRRLLKRDNTKWDLEIAVNAITAYEKISPLSFDDMKYIFVYLSFPQKYWKISKDYYNNLKKCNKNSFYILLTKAVEKDDFQLSFVKEFKKYIENRYDTSIF